MSKQIQDRKVTKKYIALVKGVIAENEATIDLPIARSTKDRKKMGNIWKLKNLYYFCDIKIISLCKPMDKKDLLKVW